MGLARWAGPASKSGSTAAFGVMNDGSVIYVALVMPTTFALLVDFLLRSLWSHIQYLRARPGRHLLPILYKILTTKLEEQEPKSMIQASAVPRTITQDKINMLRPRFGRRAVIRAGSSPQPDRRATVIKQSYIFTQPQDRPQQ